MLRYPLLVDREDEVRVRQEARRHRKMRQLRVNLDEMFAAVCASEAAAAAVTVPCELGVRGT